MFARVYFVDDSKDSGYDPFTSFEVILSIKNRCIGFFDEVEKDYPGTKTARLASAGDAKLTESDIRKWDSLVRNDLLPWLDANIAEVRTERDTLKNASKKIYDQQIETMMRNREEVEKMHVEFMNGFENIMRQVPIHISA